MASSRKPGPKREIPASSIVPARTKGPLGIQDQADPIVIACFSDTPGPLGVGDYADPFFPRTTTSNGQPLVQQTRLGNTLQGSISVDSPSKADTNSKSSIAESADKYVTESKGTWRLAKSLFVLRAQVNIWAPGRSKKSDGTIGDAAHQSRDSDHNPWVKDGAMGVVTALDITHDPGGGCDANLLAEAIRASLDVRVKYIIWNKQIANSSSWKWEAYKGTNPHDKHVHISVKSDKANYDATADWSVSK